MYVPYDRFFRKLHGGKESMHHGDQKTEEAFMRLAAVIAFIREGDKVRNAGAGIREVGFGRFGKRLFYGTVGSFRKRDRGTYLHGAE